MIVLDMKTVMFANVIVNFVGMVVMFILWFQNRNKYSGIAYWVLGWILLAGGALLITLQGTIPPWESIILSNSMIVGGTLILYFGLRRFAGKKSNPLLISLVSAVFVIFVAIHTYFTYVHIDLLARSYNVSAGLLLACLMGLWLLFKGVSPQIRRISKGTGISFAIIAVVCAMRILGFSLMPQASDQFLQSGKFDALMVMLLVGAIAFLAFNLVLMVNRRLYVETEEMDSVIKENIMELQAIFKTTAVGFGILVNRVFKEANAAFCQLLDYSREEIIGKESRMFYATDEEYQARGIPGNWTYLSNCYSDRFCHHRNAVIA
jgi:PAS domain-containing protein